MQAPHWSRPFQLSWISTGFQLHLHLGNMRRHFFLQSMTQEIHLFYNGFVFQILKLTIVESFWLKFDRLHWPGGPDSTALYCCTFSPPSTTGFPISFLLTASALSQATTNSTQGDAPSLRPQLLHRHAHRVPLPAMPPPSPALLCAAADNDRRQVFSDSPLSRVNLPHPLEF